MARPKAPNVSIRQLHVDKREALRAEADAASPAHYHLYKRGDVSQEELVNNGLAVVKWGDIRKDAPPEIKNNPVKHRTSLLCRASRRAIMEERIERESYSRENVERSMKAGANQDKDEFESRSVTRKPKDPRDIGKRTA